MIFTETEINLIDNFGVKTGKCFHIFEGFKRKRGSTGDVVYLSVRTKIVNKDLKKKKFLALITGVNNNIKRKNGNYINFTKNMGVILQDKTSLAGTRVLSPISNEVRHTKIAKLISLAPAIL